jgi:hypothetical protein
VGPRNRPPRVRSGRTSIWVIAAITLFVVADVLLIWAAVQSARTPPAPSGRDASPVDVQIEPSATPSPSAEPTVAPDYDVARPVAIIAAFDDTVAYRALAGECPAAPPDLEVTTDAGATWATASVTNASAIEAITPEDEDTVSVVAREGDGCEPALFRSFVQGIAWAAADGLDTRWRVEGAQVTAPGGAVVAPCAAPVQVAALSSSAAAVLCADAVVHSTIDGGAGWAASEPISGAAAIAAGNGGYLVAIERQGDCAGVQVATLDTVLTLGAPGGCVASEAGPGQTGLTVSADGSAVWLWSGGVVGRSFDGGQSW